MSLQLESDDDCVDVLDRRTAPRETVHCIAWIDIGTGVLARPCVIADVSSSGARLAIAPDMRLPSEFQIALSRDGRVRRRCKVSWRNGNQVGVHYLARPTWDFTV